MSSSAAASSCELAGAGAAADPRLLGRQQAGDSAGRAAVGEAGGSSSRVSAEVHELEGDEGAPRASDPSEGGESGRSSPESISRPSLTLLAMLIEAITRCASSSAHEIAERARRTPPQLLRVAGQLRSRHG